MSFIVSKFYKGQCCEGYLVLVVVSGTFDIWNTISYTGGCCFCKTYSSMYTENGTA